ncbi:MAG: aspartate aminotransferase [Thermomicrobiales bacterium]|nr:aspartate aminotransferase [Thermomicrobiales bacterium]
MRSLSLLAESLPRSGIREVMELAAKLDGVIHLEVGEPSFNTPAHIVEAALAAAKAGSTKYTPNAGIASVRQTVAERYAAAWGRPLAPEQVLVTAGAVNAIMTTLAAIVDDGDEVLVPDPGWPNYTSIITFARAVPVAYPCRAEDGYLPDLEALAARITPRTKALILTNPSNPTGVVFPAATVEAIVRLAAEHDLYVIADEVYEALVFDGEHVPAVRFDDAERVIAVSGCSKTYAMTGWRLGWAITTPEIVGLAGKLMETIVSCAPSVSQRAGEAAIRGPQECVEEMRRAYQRRRDIVAETLEPVGLLPVVPTGAFYALVDLRGTGLSSRELSRRLIEEERVAAAPGDTFGAEAEGMVRISLASSDEDVAEGCRRIVAFATRHGAVPVLTAAGVSA